MAPDFAANYRADLRDRTLGVRAHQLQHGAGKQFRADRNDILVELVVTAMDRGVLLVDSGSNHQMRGRDAFREPGIVLAAMCGTGNSITFAAPSIARATFSTRFIVDSSLRSTGVSWVQLKM